MISLKAYNREIEQLIDNGQYDDAIAHSIHILVTYPKCIDAYRNLGKSLLEQKKYSEALDVFSRVLSAIPDDFNSHVGLSIIFEDQNNLDLAIWHMEQAFDVQPSNLAIQDELKRLFGRRDGEQPTKIRLTRGALVRMYARGELFQQAITEILSVLEEDPRRIDLEVILARMHYLSGAIEESETICNTILAKFPYCFEANRILHQIHLGKNDGEAAAINLNRLVSLDPYYQFIASPFSDQEVPENKVLLEKLDYVPSTNLDTQIPVWLEEINISEANKSTESLNWLNDNSKPVAPPSSNNSNPFAVNNKEIEDSVVNNLIQSDDEIPDWMKKAGWNSNADLGIGESNKGSIFESELSGELSGDESTSGLPNDNKSDPDTTVTNDDLASLFTELKEGKMDNENLASNGNEEKQFPPSDWMSQFSNSDQSTSSNSSDQDFPDWLKNFQAEEPQPTQSSDDMPDWLRDLQSEVAPSSQPTDDLQPNTQVEEPVLEETTFDNIFDEVEQPADTAVIQEIPQVEESADDGWQSVDLSKLENVEAIEHPSDPVEPAQITSDDQIPDWVKSVLISQNASEQIPQEVAIEPEIAQDITSLSEPSTDSVDSIQELDESPAESEEGLISQQTNDELLDWLRGLKTEEEPQLQTEVVSDEIEPSTTFESELIEEPISEDQISSNEVVEPSVIPHADAVEFDNVAQEPVDQVEVDNTMATSDSDSNSEVEFTEYANEMIESETQNEPIKEIQTSELHLESVMDISADNVIETINELIETGDFETISAKVTEIASQGKGLAPALDALSALSAENENNFSYWQCMGDIYSKNNQFNDALFAYQKAEDILVKTISS